MVEPRIQSRQKMLPWQELLTAQCIPVYSETTTYCGISESARLLSVEGVTANAVRRMAGNSFNLACSTAFMLYALSMLKKT